MSPQLNAITITDFRSLSGTVTIPLDAPFVLIHGPNGAGKTSVMSALELALTGEVLAMRRTDPSYQAHLQNRGAAYGKIVLAGEGIGSPGRPNHELTIADGLISGEAALTGNLSRFFSERCYLAQATLGRLLEIYQDAKPREDSPLTRFVKDLLGLDHLDALIDGLNPVGNVRNLRRLVPEYAEAERSRDIVEQRLEDSRRRVSELAQEVATLRENTRALLAVLGSEHPLVLGDEAFETIERILSQDPDEPQLVVLTGHRRDLASLMGRLAALLPNERTADQAIAESEVVASAEVLKRWWDEAGRMLESLIDKLRATFPDLPSVASTDPQTAQRTALSRVDADLERCARAIAQDDALAGQIEALDQAVAQSRARIALVDEQLGQVAGDAETLSRALVAILPHVHGESCPVCGRDYREVSTDSLVQRVSSHVVRLTEQADRLQSLGRARVQANNDLTNCERQLEASASQRLTQEVRGALKARVSDLSESRRQLTEVASLADAGSEIIRRAAQTRRRLSEHRSLDTTAAEIRAAVGQLCSALGQQPLANAESIGNAIHRLYDYVTDRERTLNNRQRLRRDALAQYRLLRERDNELRRVTALIARDTKLRIQQEDVFLVVDDRRQAAKAVSRAAAEARTNIVGRVFNSALNKIWRDLFVRLAPTEPYVPAFRLPESPSEPVSAQLETVHRDGGRGGAPGAMLSAGNLNTAALTLFLALHLAVTPQLRWLVLDDPVQSMDEVHIAQFAALLRTLSRQHGRKIIMAVHERPLFEYLALELSPAFAGDRLITVEISRSQTGTSLAEPTYRDWAPDSIVAA
jgi:exonuclease SbcC